MSVERWNPITPPRYAGVVFARHPDGPWVKYEDYAALEEKLAEALERGARFNREIDRLDHESDLLEVKIERLEQELALERERTWDVINTKVAAETQKVRERAERLERAGRSLLDEITGHGNNVRMKLVDLRRAMKEGREPLEYELHKKCHCKPKVTKTLGGHDVKRSTCSMCSPSKKKRRYDDILHDINERLNRLIRGETTISVQRIQDTDEHYSIRIVEEETK